MSIFRQSISPLLRTATTAATKRAFYTTMSEEKSGITGWASADGSFKRQQSSFRDHIEEGGKFAPEKG